MNFLIVGLACSLAMTSALTVHWYHRVTRLQNVLMIKDEIIAALRERSRR